MQKYFLFFIILFLSTASFGQSGYPYQDIKLEKPSDYNATEPLALSAATFLLTTPFIEVDVNRANAFLFLTTWMEGAKNYNFYTQGVVQQINTDKNLLSLYIAAMAKYSLEHKTELPDALTVEKNACKLLLAYCDDPANKFKLKKKLRTKLENN